MSAAGNKVTWAAPAEPRVAMTIMNETGLQDVRDWLADPGSNHGWVLRSLSENFGFPARQFASREYAGVHAEAEAP